MTDTKELRNTTGRDIITEVSRTNADEGFIAFQRKTVQDLVEPYRDMNAPKRRTLTGPIMIQDPNQGTGEAGRITLVRLSEDWMGSNERTLLMLAGAEVNYSSTDGGRGSNRLDLSHSFACDFEGSPSSLARLNLASVSLKSVWGNQVTYDAWITEASFYLPGDEGEHDTEAHKTIFGAEYEQPTDEDRYTNCGYPYSAPKRKKIRGHKLPLHAEIVQYSLGQRRADEWFRQEAGLSEEED